MREQYLLAMQLGDKAWVEGARYYAPLFFSTEWMRDNLDIAVNKKNCLNPKKIIWVAILHIM